MFDDDYELLRELEELFGHIQERVDDLDLNAVEHQITLEESRKDEYQAYLRFHKNQAQKYLKAIKELEDAYPGYVARSRDFPYGWMKENNEIKRMLKRTRFVEFWKYIMKTATAEITKELQEFIPYRQRTVHVETDKGRVVTREKILYAMNYEEADKELSLSKREIQKYLASAVNVGIVKVTKNGCGGSSPRPTIYELGSWNNSPFGKTPIWLLNEKSSKDKLHEFYPDRRSKPGKL